MAPSWWISGAATVAVSVLLAYVESAAAADLARSRKQYETLRTAIDVGQAVDVRELAWPGSSSNAGRRGPAAALVIVLLLTAGAAVGVFAWAGYFA